LSAAGSRSVTLSTVEFDAHTIASQSLSLSLSVLCPLSVRICENGHVISGDGQN